MSLAATLVPGMGLWTQDFGTCSTSVVTLSRLYKGLLGASVDLALRRGLDFVNAARGDEAVERA